MHGLSGRVWVTGHAGMVGSAIVRKLRRRDCTVLTVDRRDLDLRRAADVDAWLAAHRPDIIFHAAALVGGIAANVARPAEFLFDNVAMTANVLDSARRHDVRKLMLLGSSCMYPRAADQPMRESALMTGPLEATNEPYAVAKIAGHTMCAAYRRQYGCNFLSVIPTNLFGPGDNLDPAANHVVPALIAKIDNAKRTGAGVEIWGSGDPRREFLYVDDAADAMLLLMARYDADDGAINIGGGACLSVRELARAVADCVGYDGAFDFDRSRPDGMPLKALDGTRLAALGWRPQIPFEDGLASTYRWFCAERDRRAGALAGLNPEP